MLPVPLWVNVEKGQCRNKMETDWINVPTNQEMSMISGKPREVRER